MMLIRLNHHVVPSSCCFCATMSIVLISLVINPLHRMKKLEPLMNIASALKSMSDHRGESLKASILGELPQYSKEACEMVIPDCSELVLDLEEAPTAAIKSVKQAMQSILMVAEACKGNHLGIANVEMDSLETFAKEVCEGQEAAMARVKLAGNMYYFFWFVGGAELA
jgi:hypothetical protein